MDEKLSRRTFLAAAVSSAGGIAAFAEPDKKSAGSALPEPTPDKLPPWRGFNLLEKFHGRNEPFREQDFADIADMGFNFGRVPMDYRAWVEENDWTRFRKDTLEEIDQAVDYGRRHDVHVMLNFHRAPGYTVARPPEPASVWEDAEAQRICAMHWAHFAKRYEGVPNRLLSFNLFNEPAKVDAGTHRKVVERMVEAVRAEDPDRLIVCDGRDWARTPPRELLGLNVAAATHGYEPMQLTHYKAGWVEGAESWPEPDYPLQRDSEVIYKAHMRQHLVQPWKQLEADGMGVFVGEFGAFNKTPHEVVLAWMRDLVSLWREAGWGYALWNFRGSFGILDSSRDDVDYERWNGKNLDRKMLDVLRGEEG